MESPFAHKLNDDVPTTNEIQEINESFQKPVEHSLELDGELDRLWNELPNFVEEHEKLHEDNMAHKALTSMNDWLPRELFQEIFIRCLPTDHNAVMSAEESPVLLGRVCSSWRTISLSTPQLWSSLHIPVPPSSYTHGTTSYDRTTLDQRNALVQTWLNRAGACTLSISLTTNGLGSIDIEPVAVDLLLQTVLSFAKQWRRIEIRIPTQLSEPLATIATDELRLLQSLQLHLPEEYIPAHSSHQPHGTVFRTLHNLLNASNLTRVRLKTVQTNPFYLPLNWSKLTEFSYDTHVVGWGSGGLSPREALLILARCPQLIRCKLHIVSAGSSSDLVAVPLVRLEHLMAISVIEGDDVDLVMFFEHLELPVVREVSFSCGNTRGLFTLRSPSSFITLLQRCQTVKILRIHTSAVTEQDLFDCLRLSPQVTELQLINDPYAFDSRTDKTNTYIDNVLLRMTLHAGSDLPPLCPNLQTFVSYYGTAASDDVVINFIRARFPRLNDVAISFPRHPDINVSVALAHEIGSGLRLLLKYGSQVGLRRNSPWQGLQRGRHARNLFEPPVW